MPLPTRNTAYTFRIGLVSRSTGQFQANPTIAAGDFQVSLDGGSFSNLATLPTITPSGGRVVTVSLSASEMDADNVVVQAVDQAGDEWNDVLIPIETRLITDSDLLVTKRYVYNYSTITTVTESQKRVRVYDDDDTDGTGSVLYDFTIDTSGSVETRNRGS